MKFEHPCSRCGFCCLMETCPIGQQVYGVAKHAQCPGLSFTGDTAACALAGVLVPIGDGCCIKARAIRNGVTYDFAALSPEVKTKCVQAARGLAGRVLAK